MFLPGGLVVAERHVRENCRGRYPARQRSDTPLAPDCVPQVTPRSPIQSQVALTIFSRTHDVGAQQREKNPISVG